MGGEVARPSICLGLNDAPCCFAVHGTMDQHFPDTLAGDRKDRLRVEIAVKLQTCSYSLAFGSCFQPNPSPIAK